MKKKLSFKTLGLIILTIVFVAIFILASIRGKKNGSSQQPVTDNEPPDNAITDMDDESVYYENESEIPSETFCIAHLMDDGSKRFYPLYQAESTISDYHDGFAGMDPDRIFWLNSQLDEKKLPTMYPGDVMIYKSDTYVPDLYYLEKFFDNGYTFGVSGLYKDMSGYYRYGGTKTSYAMQTSDASAFGSLTADNIYFLTAEGRWAEEPSEDKKFFASHKDVPPTNEIKEDDKENSNLDFLKDTETNGTDLPDTFNNQTDQQDTLGQDGTANEEEPKQDTGKQNGLTQMINETKQAVSEMVSDTKDTVDKASQQVSDTVSEVAGDFRKENDIIGYQQTVKLGTEKKSINDDIISRSGTIQGLVIGDQYDCDIRTGTEKIQSVKLTANIHAFSSAECYVFGGFTFVNDYIIKVDIPDYVTTGYYNLNGGGYFRYVTGDIKNYQFTRTEKYEDGTEKEIPYLSYQNLQKDDYNKTIYKYNDNGDVVGSTIGKTFDEYGRLEEDEVLFILHDEQIGDTAYSYTAEEYLYGLRHSFAELDDILGYNRRLYDDETTVGDEAEEYSETYQMTGEGLVKDGASTIGEPDTAVSDETESTDDETDIQE